MAEPRCACSLRKTFRRSTTFFTNVINYVMRNLSISCISPDDKACMYTSENFQDVQEPEVRPSSQYFRTKKKKKIKNKYRKATERKRNSV